MCARAHAHAHTHTEEIEASTDSVLGLEFVFAVCCVVLSALLSPDRTISSFLCSSRKRPGVGFAGLCACVCVCVCAWLASFCSLSPLHCFSMGLRDPAEATTDIVCTFYCFSMVLRDTAEAITDRVCNCYCLAWFCVTLLK